MTAAREQETAPSLAQRRAAMALMAEANPQEVESGLAALAPLPPLRDLRAPEIGLVMVRGRIGGDGAAFNLGEATVTRAAVALGSGEVGFGHVLGRDKAKARFAAIVDALWQSADHRDAVEARVLAPLRARLDAERHLSRARTAATRVDFFTLVRGED